MGTALRTAHVGWVLVLIVGAGLAGCAGLALDHDLQAVQLQVAALKENERRLTARLESLEVEPRTTIQTATVAVTTQGRPHAIQQSVRTPEPDMAALNERADRLASWVEHLTRLAEDQAVRTHEVTRRLDMLEARFRALRTFEADFPGETGTGSIRPGPGEKAVPRPLSPDRLYHQAYRDYVRGDYDLALQGFRRYLEDAPNGRRVADAAYWIGECLDGKGDAPAALTAFEHVAEQYPTSEIMSSALLKAGRTAQRLNQRDRARTHLEHLVRKFPASSDAAQARRLLEELR